MIARLASNRRVAVVALAAAFAFLALVLVLRAGGGGGDAGPANAAAKLVPDTTLVYASLSTDGERDAVDQALALARRFESYDRARDALVRRLSGDDAPVDAARDVAPWLGDEAAFALMDSGTATAGSLVAIAVTDEDRARRLLERNPRPAVRKQYKGRETVRYGQVTTAFAEGFLLIGQDPTVQAAIDRVESGARALDGQATYRRALDGLPTERVFTAYASADGLRRLLVPQGDILGGLATMLDQPGLQGVALGAAPDGEHRVRVRVGSVLDAAAQKRTPTPFRQFEPALVDAVPADALAYLGASGISGALQRLVVSGIGGEREDQVTELLGRLRTELDRETGGGLERDLLELLQGEVALVIQRQAPVPILSLVTRTEDEEGTRRTLDRLRDPLARLLRPGGEPELKWQARDLAGTDAWTLSLPNGAAITYGVGKGRLVVSTSPDGVARILEADESLEDSETFREVLGGRPERVGTLGFLDFSQLLELGEQTGLNDSRAYTAVRDDLHKIRAIGVSSSSDEGESTAEILVSIP